MRISRFPAAAAALAVFSVAGLVFAQKDQFPWNDYRVEGDLTVIHVQGNVYMLHGLGGNVAVQIGDSGVLVVNTGSEHNAPRLIAAIRKLSSGPLQYIINTSADPDQTGGNAAVRKIGVTITGANVTGDIADAAQGAQIVAHENVLNRMSAPTGKKSTVPFDAWPTDTYVSGQKEVFFNEEPVIARWQPAAHTDGDSLVIFRRSDVVVTGDVFNTESYPDIDVERGGSIQGEIDALNNIIDIAVPKHEEEGGTYIIPGHGRICDEFDVVEYRDMVTIVRERVQNAIKKGMTLDQIKAAGFTKDYDARWSAKSGPGTADNFVTSVYKSLAAKEQAKSSR
ncbi:MAG TPA: MBL fold metallo-hydrolase [Bryobacteraceae bacterium]|nr:MBL fold metallo-hydrolase [Bryobacteraceae bacterium]